MKQGNPRKKFGVIALLGAMISGLVSRSNTDNAQVSELHQRKNFLLTNGGRAPIPGRMKNQRQKRKLNRQMSNFK